jgi:hypothetical protein
MKAGVMASQLVDRLHRGDAVRRSQPLQRGHYERREGEENAGDKAASEGGRQLAA